jgi:hypothetical protein
MSNADWLAQLKRELQHFCSDGNSCSFGGPAAYPRRAHPAPFLSRIDNFRAITLDNPLHSLDEREVVLR